MSHPHLESVNVLHELRPGYLHDTAIDMRPVPEPVEVTKLGTHGGPDKAVYAYATEDAEWRSRAAVPVTMPRTPCQNLSRRMGIDGFPKRCKASGRHASRPDRNRPAASSSRGSRSPPASG